MPVSITLQEIPIGSQFVQAIGSNDPDALNDFKVRILASENATGLELSDLSFTVALTGSSSDVSDHVSLVSLTGKNNVWELTVRPPAAGDIPGSLITSGVIMLTIAADAVDQGNPETSKDIRFSRTFPDDDAEVPTLLLDSDQVVTPRFAEAVSDQLSVNEQSGYERR